MNFIWGKILETGVYGNKKTYKSVICRFLSSYCPFLSSKFCGETGSRTYRIIENHKISIRCKLSVYKIVKFIEAHREHFDI